MKKSLTTFVFVTMMTTVCFPAFAAEPLDLGTDAGQGGLLGFVSGSGCQVGQTYQDGCQGVF